VGSTGNVRNTTSLAVCVEHTTGGHSC
jgi:hypothetical protein